MKYKLGQLSKQRKSNFSWLAGCIDCDGSIFWANYKDKKRPCVCFSNTNEKLVQRMSEVLGGKIYTITDRKVSSKLTGTHFLTVYEIRICRVKQILSLLERIEPYLVAKKDKANEVLDFYRKEVQ